jgi:hypothetical protein
VMLGKNGQVSADRAAKFMANLARGVSSSAWRAAGYGGKLKILTATLAAIGKYPALLAMLGINKAWRAQDDDTMNDEELYRDTEGDAMTDKRITELSMAMKNDPLSTTAGLYAGSLVLPVNINGQFPYKRSNEILEGIAGKKSYATTAADFIAAQSGGLLPTAKFGMDMIDYGKNVIANPTEDNILGGAAYVGAKNIPLLRKSFGQDYLSQRKPGKSEMAKGQAKDDAAERLTPEEIAANARIRAASMGNKGKNKYNLNMP